MNTWIWQQIKINLPPAWELLQFSKDAERGRCAFADRTQFRLEMDWSRISSQPDMPRVLSDYQTKMESEQRITSARPAKIAGWNGFTGIQNDQPISRFGTYLQENSSLVELVFLWAGERDNILEKSILQQVAYAPATENDATPWSAFGMNIQVPEALPLQHCLVKPAFAELIFAQEKKPERLRVQRAGHGAAMAEGIAGCLVTPAGPRQNRTAHHH